MSSPLVLLHGFTDTPRTWELVRPALETEYQVIAPALPGHLGGPPLDGVPTAQTLPDAVERAMDDAGIELAHLAGNSLGGYVALQLAERGRALSVVALAPGGGWGTVAERDDTLDFFVALRSPTEHAARHADRIASTRAGRRRATQFIVSEDVDLPEDLVAHQIRGAAACEALPLIEVARTGYPLDAARVTCPLRIVWGADDRVLRWPAAAERYRALFPNADWVVLDGVGHCPQLDRPLETAQLILGFSA
ncbi:MAG TPA: alpha/beta fold hydrolase [Gaiellaceae bacterium]|nr:alpha/beta fold hydrolase [Gaiellaceae bacterium]